MRREADSIQPISLADYFMGRDLSHAHELTAALRTNATLTVERANALLLHAALSAVVNSGWRPQAVNAAVPNASPRSKHLSCQAIDLDDADGKLDAWCMHNLRVLEQIGLWLEHPDATPGWCHVQVVPPRSGRRVFMP